MKITKISPFTGIEHTMDIDVSQEQWDQYAEGTILIQHCFPKLTWQFPCVSCCFRHFWW